MSTTLRCPLFLSARAMMMLEPRRQGRTRTEDQHGGTEARLGADASAGGMVPSDHEVPGVVGHRAPLLLRGVTPHWRRHGVLLSQDVSPPGTGSGGWPHQRDRMTTPAWVVGDTPGSLRQPPCASHESPLFKTKRAALSPLACRSPCTLSVSAPPAKCMKAHFGRRWCPGRA